MNTENLKQELNDFLSSEQPKQTAVENESEVVITPRTGLVERIEKTLITPDGRQLLTERHF